MQITKILAAYDGSEESEKAYFAALDLAQKYNAEVLVLSVIKPPEPPIAEGMEAFFEAARDYFERSSIALSEKSQGITPRFEICIGHPVEQIVMYANKENADMVVMGHRGGGSFLEKIKLRLGSVARQVMNYAQCIVVIVR